MAVVEGIITFRGNAEYWRPGTHSIKASYIRASARKKWGFEFPTKIGNDYDESSDFEVPFVGKNCRVMPGGWLGCAIGQIEHEVAAQQVYDWCQVILGGKVPEKVVVERVFIDRVIERVVERGYVTTIERHEALSFALTRELRFTQYELETAYADGDADYAHRLAHRVTVIREVMTDLGATEMFGSPTWMIPYLIGNGAVEDRAEEAQMELFDAVR